MGTVEIFDDRRCRLGEGPCYDDRTDRVWWVDILGRRLLWRTFATDEAGELHLPEHVGAVVPDRSDGLIVCLPAGPALLPGAAGSAPYQEVAPVPLAPFPVDPAGPPALRANDAKADPAGRLWLGTMAYDEHTRGRRALPAGPRRRHAADDGRRDHDQQRARLVAARVADVLRRHPDGAGRPVRLRPGHRRDQ